ncbi:efflux RND transporter periplasmic adaptor subunit [Stella sp.]|uniref:efflux RND transporter periplasmic adaptor subunit n=1 Tax=Stella sp. TaxID=2912054 RepID=UPI0035B00525
MQRQILLRTAAALALVAVAGGIAACKRDEAVAREPTPPRVQVDRVTFQPSETARTFVGVVQPRYETDLGFRVAGKVVERPVNVGDPVRKGDLVARLDTTDLRLQVESTEAELAAATSSLAQAAADERRYAGLRSSGFAAAADYDRKKAARDEAEGRAKRARRSLELARNQLEYGELRASADGVVTAAPVEAGQVVAIGQAVVRVAQTIEREALVALPETWLADAPAASAVVRLWSQDVRPYRASLRELSPQADPATRTYAARFRIEEAGPEAAFGMTATVTLTRQEQVAAAQVPLSAIVNRGAGPHVYVVDPRTETLLERPVTVATFGSRTAAVTDGLSDGETIVTLGVQKLEAGRKVRPLPLR